jgi:SAM-dependent methyltransferase
MAAVDFVRVGLLAGAALRSSPRESLRVPTRSACYQSASGQPACLARIWQSCRAMQPIEATLSRATAVDPTYLLPYRRALDRNGPTFEALLYYNRDTQSRRFEALAKITPLQGRRIVDFGCGHGDLLLWLERYGIDCNSYQGVDAFPELIAVARSNAASARATTSFAVADFVDCELASFVATNQASSFVFSGSLNLLSQTVALELLRRAWRALCQTPGNALAFNFLSRCASYQGVDDESLNRFQAVQMLEFALELTPLTVFCQHYLAGHDATISMIVP